MVINDLLVLRQTWILNSIWFINGQKKPEIKVACWFYLAIDHDIEYLKVAACILFENQFKGTQSMNKVEHNVCCSFDLLPMAIQKDLTCYRTITTWICNQGTY